MHHHLKTIRAFILLHCTQLIALLYITDKLSVNVDSVIVASSFWTGKVNGYVLLSLSLSLSLPTGRVTFHDEENFIQFCFCKLVEENKIPYQTF